MLTSLTLRSVATYPAEGVTISGLQPVSFIFGSNGSGKTTLSNCIANPASEDFKHCELQWANGERLAVHVYNKRFREANLRQADIPGVFTMGEDSVGRLEQRKAKEEERKALLVTATQQRANVAEYKGKLEKANEDFTKHEWDTLHKKHKDAFAPAFKGASRTLTFRDKLLQEARSNTAELSTLEELKERAAVAFKGDPAPLEFLPRPQAARLLELEQDGIWATPIVGKGDVPIAALIGRLENSDWVNTGRGYLTDSDTCPFCQQPTVTEALRQQLEQFFDES